MPGARVYSVITDASTGVFRVLIWDGQKKDVNGGYR